ncbi:hypothetical protein FSOLCH5_001663 [Fusarium solani]|jgi:hypothetical protein
MQPTLVSFTHAFFARTITLRPIHVRIPFRGSPGPDCQVPFPSFLALSLSAPDVLEEAISLGQSVEGVVALAHRSDETAEGVGVVLALDGTAVLVDLGNRDLDGAVVLGLDDAVGGAALAGDVTGDATSVWDCSPMRPSADGVLSWDLTGPRSRHGRSPFLRFEEGVVRGGLGDCFGVG